MNNFLVKTSGLNSGDDLVKEKSVKTLVLLHGWGMNSRVWEPIRKALEARYHLIWIDLPGHGFNRSVKALSLDNMVAVITDVIPENSHLIAWSLGGLVAQALEQEMPQKIASMTLVTSTPSFSQGVDGDWQHAMSDQLLNRFADNLKQDTEKTLKGFIALQFLGVKDAKHAQDELIKHILYNRETANKWGGVILDDELHFSAETNLENSNIPSQEALDVGLDILKHADLRLFKPSCPQHWIFSEYDRLIPKEVINDLISLRPDAEITLLEKAGHAPFITHSEAFLKHTIGFIDAIN